MRQSAGGNERLRIELGLLVRGSCAICAWLLCTLVNDGYSAAVSDKGLGRVLLLGTGALLKFAAFVGLGILTVQETRNLSRIYNESNRSERLAFKKGFDGHIARDASFVAIAALMLNAGYFAGDDIKAGLISSISAVAFAVGFGAIASAYISMSANQSQQESRPAFR